MPLSSAALVRTSRTRAGLTQHQLAERAGVTQGVVSSYEANKRRPSLATVEKLVRAAGFELFIELRPTPQPTLLETVLSHRDEIVHTFADLGADNVRVFGSAARGEDHGGSDVDLLVDLRDGVGLFALAGMTSAAERILGVAVDVVPADSLKQAVAASAAADAIDL